LWNVIMTALKGRVEPVPIPAVLAAYA
jgi:hypothetical protein